MTAPQFQTRHGPVPQPLRDLFWSRAGEGPSLKLELIPDQPHAPGVALYAATLIPPGTCRGTILFLDPTDSTFHMRGIDSGPIDTARWFREYGVPVLRIGKRLT